MKQDTIVENGVDFKDDILLRYYRDIARYRPLKFGEEAHLAQRIKKGDRSALDLLVKSNLRFVIKVARGYQAQGVELMDLINIGNVGLIKAAMRFDEKKNFKFISYAVWWIRQAILQALADQSRIYKIPVNKVADIYKVHRTTELLRQKYQRYPHNGEVAQSCGMNEKTVDYTKVIAQKYIHLDAPAALDVDIRMADLLEDTTIDRPDAVPVLESFQKRLIRSLDCLKTRERDVIILYFGIGQDAPYTLSEIGEKYRITRERVRQLRDKALIKLRNREIENLFEDYYNN